MLDIKKWEKHEKYHTELNSMSFPLALLKKNPWLLFKTHWKKKTFTHSSLTIFFWKPKFSRKYPIIFVGEILSTDLRPLILGKINSSPPWLFKNLKILCPLIFSEKILRPPFHFLPKLASNTVMETTLCINCIQGDQSYCPH